MSAKGSKSKVDRLSRMRYIIVATSSNAEMLFEAKKAVKILQKEFKSDSGVIVHKDVLTLSNDISDSRSLKKNLCKIDISNSKIFIEAHAGNFNTIGDFDNPGVNAEELATMFYNAVGEDFIKLRDISVCSCNSGYHPGLFNDEISRSSLIGEKLLLPALSTRTPRDACAFSSFAGVFYQHMHLMGAVELNVSGVLGFIYNDDYHGHIYVTSEYGAGFGAKIKKKRANDQQIVLHAGGRVTLPPYPLEPSIDHDAFFNTIALKYG